MPRSILVPLDGSPFAEQAIPLALELARGGDASLRLVVVHVPLATAFVDGVPQYEPATDAAIREAEENYLAGVTGRVTAATDVPVVSEYLAGPVVSVLAGYIQEKGIGLVVLSTHGRGGFSRAWLGSVADGLARHSAAPLLLVRPASEASDGVDARAPEIRRILIPLDGSPLAEQAVAPAVDLARQTGASILLLRILSPIVPLGSPYVEVVNPADLHARESFAVEYLEKVAARLRSQEIDTTVLVTVHSQPAAAILETTTEAGADLIALASHGRGSLSRLVLGSVSDKVIRGASVPVLLFRPEAEA